MKQVAVILILIVFLVQLFSKVIIIARYEINKDYVARVLCENRDKPQMHCNGKCQLSKQLKADEQKESSLPFQNLKDVHEVLYFSFCKLTICCLEKIIPIGFSIYIESKSNPHLLSVFHPPSV